MCIAIGDKWLQVVLGVMNCNYTFAARFSARNTSLGGAAAHHHVTASVRLLLVTPLCGATRRGFCSRVFHALVPNGPASLKKAIAHIRHECCFSVNSAGTRGQSGGTRARTKRSAVVSNLLGPLVAQQNSTINVVLLRSEGGVVWTQTTLCELMGQISVKIPSHRVSPVHDWFSDYMEHVQKRDEHNVGAFSSLYHWCRQLYISRRCCAFAEINHRSFKHGP